jgi:hypothetical protein
VRADRGGGYVRGYTVYRGEKVLFQDSQNLGSQGSLDMYTLHEVNTKLLILFIVIGLSLWMFHLGHVTLLHTYRTVACV